MKLLIKDITHIQTGLFAKPSGKGEVVYLQTKHFDEYGQLQSTLYPDLMADSISENHLLKDRDVLFSAKGTKNFATVYQNHNAPAVASTSFFVIRLIDKNVLPEYLAWFLNSYTTQTFLKGKAIGTSIASISKVVLEELKISIPSIEIQKAILQIANLQNKEKSLKQEIETLREKLIQQIILNIVNQ